MIDPLTLLFIGVVIGFLLGVGVLPLFAAIRAGQIERQQEQFVINVGDEHEDMWREIVDD